MKKFVAGVAAVAILAVFGGMAYAQQNAGPQDPGQRSGVQEQQANPGGGGSDRGDCPWKQDGGASDETEV